LQVADLRRGYSTFTEARKMDDKLVLVVEDEPTIAMLLKHLVKSYGLRAEVAHGGLQALESLRAQRPDLVLLDLIMPGVSGDKVLATMQADPNLREVPVIVISTWEGVEREVPRLGKPFEPADVQRLIREALDPDARAA
jgi:CheY-like chemotaxis protein